MTLITTEPDQLDEAEPYPGHTEEEISNDEGRVNIMRTGELLKELDRSIQEGQETHRQGEPFVTAEIGPVRRSA